MQVFRVENAEGLGPYRHTFESEFYAARFAIEQAGYDYFDYHNSRPAPYHDGIEISRLCNGHVCGFLSLEQLLAWFEPKVLDLLEEQEFRVVVYEAEEVFIGIHQVIFDRLSAEKIACLTPDNN